MKKSFLLLFLFCIGLSVGAQPQYTNGVSGVSGVINLFPFRTNPSTGKKVQWILAPGHFSQPSPIGPGNEISSIWFWPATPCDATYNNLTVRMATVPVSTFFSLGAFYTGPMTTVRSENTTITSPGGTYVEIPLTTTFAYDPSMSLIIEVSQCGWTGTSFSIYQSGLGAYPNYIRQYSDAASLCGATALPTGGDFYIPALGISTGTSCMEVAFFRDMDNDGYGNPAITIMACPDTPPAGYVTDNTDCNDNNAAIKPGVAEVCDGIDNNCNGMTDEGVLTTFYHDFDGDGFGNPSVTQQACSAPGVYVADNTDCNDNNLLEQPGQVWYKDVDNDGYAETGTATITQCLRPVGYIAAAELISTTGDCNDNNAAIKPGATEVCDGVDNNCNGMTDEGVQTTYYRDMDMDGFGNPSVTQMACSQPTGYVANNTDCNDNNALEKPGQIWYKDIDGDGYAETAAATINQCLRPTGYKVASELTSTTGDCNDNDNTIYPGAFELCDDKDNDCDTQVDEAHGLANGWSSGTVGSGVNGSAGLVCSVDNKEIFNVSANGYSSPVADQLNLVYKTLCGDGEIIARVDNVSGGGWAGITLRETLVPGSKKVGLKTQLTPTIRREIRANTNGPNSLLNFTRPAHTWLRLVRNGSIFSGYTSNNGTAWTFAFTATVPMTGCIYAGLFAESVNVNTTTTASFGDVAVIGGNPVLARFNSDLILAEGLDFSLFPNPTSGELTLNLASYTGKTLRLEVYNLQGQLLQTTKIEEAQSTERLDLSAYQNGMYLVKLKAEGQPDVTKRVVLSGR